MVKHKLKNIANRAIPVDGTNLRPMPGQIVEAEITLRLKYMIKNSFFEDLGKIEEKKEEKEEKKSEEGTIATCEVCGGNSVHYKKGCLDCNEYREKEEVNPDPGYENYPKNNKKTKKQKKINGDDMNG